MTTCEDHLGAMTVCRDSDFVVQALPEYCWCVVEAENGTLVPCRDPIALTLHLKLEDNKCNTVPLCWKHYIDHLFLKKKINIFRYFFFVYSGNFSLRYDKLWGI